MISMKVYDECIAFRNKTGRWPRTKIKIKNVRVFKKDIIELFKKGLIDENMYKELMEEATLSNRWRNCEEHKILMKYVGVPISKVPEEYRAMIDTLREFGIGHPAGKIDVVERFESFYQKHGRIPRWLPVKRDLLTEQEVVERRLYELWIISDASMLSKKYAGTPIEEIPEEHQETIKRLRAMGVGTERKLSALEEYMDFVWENAREPIHYVNPVGDEQIKEHAIKQRWRGCAAHLKYEKYKGVLLEEIPEEDRPLISQLRQMWLKVDGEHVMEEVFDFIDRNKREPIDTKQGRRTFGRELTEEELKEADLAARWSRCFEKQVMDRFSKRKNIPQKYKNIMLLLRERNLGYPESFNTRMYIKYIRENGFIPRACITRNGEKISHKWYTKDELYEASIRGRFDYSDEKKIYDRYKVGKLDKKTAKVYERMLKELDEIYELARSCKAGVSEVRKKENPKDEEKIAHIEQKVANKLEQEELNLLDEKRKTIELAKIFIEFVKKNGKFPRESIKRNGVDIKRDDLTPEERREQLLRRAWDRSNFMEVVDAYAGTPIEQLPKEYQVLISEFRAQGFGLTSDEYYKYRANLTPAQVLKYVKNTRDMSKAKKVKAMRLEQEVLDQLRAKGKEQDDE
ncbi:MAG: hypothetical protein IJH12_08645 [Clostridia bacterium]|nr:hypothetical protein [Clostridia bacterium]